MTNHTTSIPYALVGLLLSAPLLLAGCANSGMFAAANVTDVQLAEANYRLVATNVSGEAEAGYLLGLSAGSGLGLSTLALIRIQGEGLLYKEALEDLWQNFEAQYGSVEGRRLALVNVRYDADALNVLGLYTRPKVSIRADVVEFES